jgi:hypothetical protein
MKHGSDDMPIACCLTSAELREREATLLAQFRSAVIESEELPNGYAFRVPGDRKWVAITAEMICGRKGVLPLLDIRVRRRTEYGARSRPCDCPTGTKDFLKTVLYKPNASI